MREDYIESGGVKEVSKTRWFSAIFRTLSFPKKIFQYSQIVVSAFRFLASLKNDLKGVEIVAVYASRTFGHDLQCYDVTSRMFFPRKVLYILIPNQKENRFLAEAFHHNINLRRWNVDPIYAENAASILKFLLYFREVKKPVWPSTYVIDPRCLMKQLCVDEGVRVFDPSFRDEEGLAFLRRMPVSGLRFLINNEVGQRPRLPSKLRNLCRDAILSVYPEFYDRKLAVVVLRQKGINGPGLNGQLRRAGPHENYFEAIQSLVSKGYWVVGTGDTRDEWFSHIKGYLDLSCTATVLDPDLLNIFLLTECNLLIGQASGPHPLVTSSGGDVALVEVMPYVNLPLGSKDVVLFKNVFYGGKETNVARVFQTDPASAFASLDLIPGYEVEHNSSDQITDAVNDIIARTEGTYQTDKDSEINELAELLRKVAPESSQNRYYDCRPTKGQLLSMKRDLSGLC